jgi:uncharacterized protein (DUF433 family)
MTTSEPITHIVRDESGVYWIDGAPVKVIEIVLDYLAYSWGAEALHEQFPSLSLAQIHAALAFFYDHEEAFQELIRESSERADRLREEAHDSPAQRRLRELKAKRKS